MTEPPHADTDLPRAGTRARSSFLLLIAGALLLLSSLAHAGLGWPAVLGELRAAKAPPELFDDMGAGWLFGSLAMATFGVIVLIAGAGGKRSARRVYWAALAIGIAYVAFGTAAMALLRSMHFLGFIVIGGLCCAGSLRGLRARSREWHDMPASSHQQLTRDPA